MKNIWFIVSAALIAGCASSGAVPIGQDTYMITKQSAGGAFVSPSSILGEIVKEGVGYCKSMGKEFMIINTQEISAIPMARMPSAEVQFMCLNAGDSRLTSPHMRKEANTVIRVEKE